MQGNEHIQAGTQADRPAWLATLAHDLRGPLSPLQTAIGLLRGGRVDAAQTAELLEGMQRQVDQLGQLIDDTAELLRGPASAPSQRIDAASLFDMVGVRLHRRFEQARIAWLAQRPEGAIEIEGDAKAWLRLLGALAARCLDAAGAGGSVSASASRDGDHVVLSLTPQPAAMGAADEFSAFAARLEATPLHVADASLQAVLQRHRARLHAVAVPPGLVLYVDAAGPAG